MANSASATIDTRRAGRQGAQAMLPLLVGVAPLGLVVGVAPPRPTSRSAPGGPPA